MNRRQWTAAAALAATSWVDAAQPYPSRPIRLIYNFAPGGPGDAVARDIATRMAVPLGQPLVVYNMSGGDGAVGILTAARAPADGYTLLFAALTGIVQVPLVTHDNSFDAFKSITPIANVGSSPLAVVAHPNVPANDFPSFVAWARKQPSGVDVAGAGPIVEIATARLARDAKLNLVWVGYRGMAPALQAVLAGEVKVCYISSSALLSSFVKSGRVKVIGVASAQPSRLFPGVAPIANFVPNYVQEIDFSLWAPPGVPVEIVSKINATLNHIMDEVDMEAKLQMNGMAKNYMNAAEVTQVVRRENETIRKILQTTSIKFGE